MKKMKKRIQSFYGIIFIVILSMSCNNSGNQSEQSKLVSDTTLSKIKTIDTLKNEQPNSVVVNSEAIAKEVKTEKAEVISAKIVYDEITIGGGILKEESNLKNGDAIWLNGCSNFELKKLNLQGTGNNLTLIIGGVYKRVGIDLSKGITITNKDVKSLDEIEVLDGKKNIFKVTFEMSGCN